MIEVLGQLQDWYLSQCDGEWEHQYGVSIDTLDNPGWTVKVDLQGTKLADKSFSAIWDERSDSDWIHCSVRDGAFEGNGGGNNLSELISVFLAWAQG